MEEVYSLVKQSGHFPFFVGECTEDATSFFRNNSYIAISDYSLDFFSKAKTELKSSFLWLSVTNLIYKNKQLIITFQKKKITIESEQIEDIFNFISHVLIQLFTIDELKLINKEIFGDKREVHSPKAAVIRYIETAHLRKEVIAPNNVEKLSKILETRPTTIDFHTFSDPFYMIPSLLSCLKLCPYVNELHLNESNEGKSIFEILQQFCDQILNFEHISITTHSLANFAKFCRKLRSTEVLYPLTALSFQNTYFKKEDLNELSMLYEDNLMTSLTLSNISIESRGSFESDFFLSNIKKTLRYLSFDNTPNFKNRFNMNQLFQHISYISVLSLENCDIEICDVFTLLDTYRMKNIRVLNLSKNKATHMPLDGFELPPQLYSLVCNNIQWSDFTMRNLMRLLLTHPYVQKLSFASAICSNEEWNYVSQQFKKSTMTQLKSFTWNENRINEKIMGFIEQNKYLEYLALCGCFSAYQSKIAALLVRYLNNKPILNTLILKGNSTNFLGRLTHTVIKSALECPCLLHLDISDNKIEDKCAEQLIEVYKSTTTALKTINFEGTSVRFFTSLRETLIAASRHRKIRTSFPNEDIQRFVKNGQITEQHAKEIEDSFRKRPKVKTNLLYTISKKSPFLTPYLLYSDKYSIKFPTYITRRETVDLGVDEDTESVFTSVDETRSRISKIDDSDDKYISIDDLESPYDIDTSPYNTNNFINDLFVLSPAKPSFKNDSKEKHNSKIESSIKETNSRLSGEKHVEREISPRLPQSPQPKTPKSSKSKEENSESSSLSNPFLLSIKSVQQKVYKPSYAQQKQQQPQRQIQQNRISKTPDRFRNLGLRVETGFHISDSESKQSQNEPEALRELRQYKVQSMIVTTQQPKETEQQRVRQRQQQKMAQSDIILPKRRRHRHRTSQSKRTKSKEITDSDSDILRTIDDEAITQIVTTNAKNKSGFEKRHSTMEFPKLLDDL